MKFRFRFYLGIILLILAIVCPLLIPLIVQSNFSVLIKGFLSSILVFGLPEVLIVLAITLLGKEVYGLLEQKIKNILFKEKVSTARYRLGLVFFAFPLVIGLLEVFVEEITLAYGSYYYWVEIIWTMMFALSFFICGKQFWDKFKSLFIYDSYVVFGKNKK
ncbi:TPA: transporter suffix domain-containing protein [Legionella pneumophila subsp. pneumophila]|nr:transporter suffix domain-containing protein [Legionella pneumophila subsp. pneumophila]HAT9650981.1 transporter suffix domain-containing protein [Legionella pneumophila subsp. pneumophila]HAT9920069.1 transporter suffix domain-containing protein [Legionella pneumophila subsp. pneumophila]